LLIDAAMMRTVLALMVLGTAACAQPADLTLGDVAVHIAAAQVPPDGQCVLVTATRLDDFAVSTYRGPLDGAVLKAKRGEHRVTAAAFPPPCDQPLAEPPWLADEQIVSLESGDQSVTLSFKRNVKVTLVPEFEGDDPAPLIVRDESYVRTGRNGEDAAGPGYSLDGWEVKVISVPPPGGGGTASETILFTSEHRCDLPYSPRGLAVTSDGRFVLQVNDVFQPLAVFDATGACLARWPVVYPGGMITWSSTDGLDAVDDDHLVRTGWLDTPICDEQGASCLQAGIEILEKQIGVDGAAHLEVIEQIFLPAPLDQQFPVGVAHVGGGRFAVSLIEGARTLLAIIDSEGGLVAGPVEVAGSVEGLFRSEDGRLVGLDSWGSITRVSSRRTTSRPSSSAPANRSASRSASTSPSRWASPGRRRPNGTWCSPISPPG
jgi:hypothetical protein